MVSSWSADRCYCRTARGLERQKHVITVTLLRGDQHADRTTGLIHTLTVVLFELAALIEDRQAHDMPVDRQTTHGRDLEDPAGSEPGPRADRVEPKIDFHQIYFTVYRVRRVRWRLRLRSVASVDTTKVGEDLIRCRGRFR